MDDNLSAQAESHRNFFTKFNALKSHLFIYFAIDPRMNVTKTTIRTYCSTFPRLKWNTDRATLSKDGESCIFRRVLFLCNRWSVAVRYNCTYDYGYTFVPSIHPSIYTEVQVYSYLRMSVVGSNLVHQKKKQGEDGGSIGTKVRSMHMMQRISLVL